MKRTSIESININSKPWTTISTEPVVRSYSGKLIKIDWAYYRDHVFDDDRETSEQIFTHLAMNHVVLSGAEFKNMDLLVRSIHGAFGKLKKFKLQMITPRQIGMTEPPSSREFYAEVFEMGFNPCPAYVGLYFCIGNNLVTIPPYLRFASKPFLGNRCISLVQKDDQESIDFVFDYLYEEQMIHLNFPHVFVIPDLPQRRSFFSSKYRNKFFPDVGLRFPIT